MTREEAKSCICTIKMLQKLAYNIHGVMDVVDADNCKKIIKALEQEPCEDCVNRQAVLNTLFYKSDNNCEVVLNKELQDRIKALPSVTPKPKMGQWIMKHRTYNKVKHYTGQDKMGETHTISVLERYEVDEPYCSKCGKLAGDTSQDFCCACGAKMVEPQESEEV